MRIREMTLDDLDAIMPLERALFKTPWSYQDFTYEVKSNPFGHYFVLLEDDQVIGFLGMWFAYEKGTITNIGISPDKQRRGYAKHLMRYGLKKALEAGVEDCSLEVRVSNTAAIRLYETFGFEIKALRKDYYEDEDAYLMIKERMDDSDGDNFSDRVEL